MSVSSGVGSLDLLIGFLFEFRVYGVVNKIPYHVLRCSRCSRFVVVIPFKVHSKAIITPHPKLNKFNYNPTGKSSIVRAISSGTPEVNNYPFTTRGMTLGHVQVFWESDQDVAIGNVAGVSIPSEKQLVQENLVRLGVKTRRMKEKELLKEFSRGGVDNDEEEEEEDGDQDGFGEFDDDDETTDLKIEKAIQTPISRKSFPISQLCQIMDSPGLLRRDDGDTRNEMEELTLAAMAHLPTAVMYVMDLSGGAGDRCSSVEDQLILRREVSTVSYFIDIYTRLTIGSRNFIYLQYRLGMCRYEHVFLADHGLMSFPRPTLESSMGQKKD